MEKLILKTPLPPGDVLMLTAAVRDLHRTYPRRFITDVRTRYPELWENNPYLTPLGDNEQGVQIIECEYPLIQRANAIPTHFLWGFIHFLNERLGLRIELTEFCGDLHLSNDERQNPSPVEARYDYEGPYWIVVSGGKRDFTIKWWDHERYQRIVDHFAGQIQFVQTGAPGHFHPELERVLDLRAKTNLRELIRVMHHANGIICPVTFMMHLSAAVPMTIPHRLRPTVVVAGGREPVHWEAYPGHHFLHTIGMLPCCRMGGCWRARTKPLHDRSHLNQSERLCVDVVGGLPKCMDMISADDVCRKIEQILDGDRRFDELVKAEKQKMGIDGRSSNRVGRINAPLPVVVSQLPAKASVRDLLVSHYRSQESSTKRPILEDLSERVLTNTPIGLGDTLLLTQLPFVAHRQQKVRYITSKSPFFDSLMKLNRHYQPAGRREVVAADALQARYDLGNGHFTQRLQRAFGLDPELIPRGYLDTNTNPQSGKVVMHFDAGSAHAAWQRIYVHPRARQLYPESRHLIQAFINSHPEMEFCEVGRTSIGLKNVIDCTARSLNETITLMADCEYFLGIISGPMHLATALGLKCIVILNFPHAHEILLPTLKDIDLIESEWLYPQNVHLHQESDGPLVKRLAANTLEMAFYGEIYPFWDHEFLPLIYEQI